MRVTYNNAWLLIALLLASSPGIFINSASLYQTSNIYDFVGKSIALQNPTSKSSGTAGENQTLTPIFDPYKAQVSAQQ